MIPQRRKQIEASLPRDCELIDDLKTAREALSLERQQRQYMMREMKRVADELGKRGLIDLADDLRLAAR